MSEWFSAAFEHGLGSCIRLFVTFGLMVWLLRRKFAVGYAILLGCVFLVAAYRMPFRESGGALLDSVRSPRTWNLLALVAAITFLGEVLRHVENLARLINSVLGHVRSRKVAMGALPAMIGLLPMPGGAMLSAPMVEEVAKGTDAGGARKTLINYWFRHIWEYINPLYPGIVTVGGMLGVSVLSFLPFNLPMTVTAVVAGVLICFRGMARETERPEGTRGIVPLLAAVWPVGFVIFVTGLPLILKNCNVQLPAFISQSKVQWPLLGAITIVLIILYGIYRIDWKTTRAMLAKSVTLELVALVYGLMLLNVVLESTGAVVDVREFLLWCKVPVLAVLFLVPFSVGLLTGITFAYVGITFTMLKSYMLFADGSVNYAHVMFAFTSGFMGVMLSPMHLCMVLTLDYFKAERGQLYKSLIPLALIVMGIATAIAIVHAMLT